MTFKDRLREEIEYQGKLVKEISAQVGISNSTFLSYIDARGVVPNVETAVKIAKVLNTSVEYLVTGEDYVSTAKSRAIHEIVCDLNRIELSELKTVKTMVHALVGGRRQPHD